MCLMFDSKVFVLLIVIKLCLATNCDDLLWAMVNGEECPQATEPPMTVLTDEDFARAKFVSDTEPPEDPTAANTQYFEGDMKGLKSRDIKNYIEDVSKVQRQLDSFSLSGRNRDAGSLMREARSSPVWRNAVRNRIFLWNDKQIPYVVSSSFTTEERAVIAAAIHEFHIQTCIRFVPRTNEASYISVQPFIGCWSLVGKISAFHIPQMVSLGSGCVHKGLVMHELMHVAGFFHEQSRTDRDQYVNIFPQNMMLFGDLNFLRYNSDVITALGTRYDYSSIMHYGPMTFSKNGQPTILPKIKGVTIGQRRGFSATDVAKLNKLYRCNAKDCKDQQRWCDYSWLRWLCGAVWMQQQCPQMCGFC